MDSVKKKMSGLTLPPMPRLPSKAKFWKKRSSSANISDYDPTFRVIYLGNVLTGWAKGEGCVDKPLATLWKNHTTTDKPNIIMKVTVCASGLKAHTKEHGLTEYWAHRITFCEAEPSYPKVFCWIYRHEGRKMKQELRCHAVLCPSENKAKLMSKRLKERLHQALVDFKKEKVWRQNARLSLANAADEQKTMPFRKIMLQAGSSNYRPPLEKGKSAPKLKVIEEVILEEDEEQISDQDDEDEDELTLTADLQQAQQQWFEDKSSKAGGSLVASKSSTIIEEDTNHITRLRVDSCHHLLPTSDSLPLLASAAASSLNSRCSSSLSMDALSTMTAVTSFMDSCEDQVVEDSNLIVISNDPSPDISRKRPRPPPIQNEAKTSDEDEEDEVTDYLDKLSVEVEEPSEVNSEAATASEVSPRDSENSPLIVGTRLNNNEQDTISDESGYSEESSPSNKEAILEAEDLEDFDLTVKGVLISDFSPSERLKYLQRSQSTSSRNRPQQTSTVVLASNNNLGGQQTNSADFFQNKVPEFCINI